MSHDEGASFIPDGALQFYLLHRAWAAQVWRDGIVNCTQHRNIKDLRLWEGLVWVCTSVDVHNSICGCTELVSSPDLTLPQGETVW